MKRFGYFSFGIHFAILGNMIAAIGQQYFASQFSGIEPSNRQAVLLAQWLVMGLLLVDWFYVWNQSMGTLLDAVGAERATTNAQRLPQRPAKIIVGLAGLIGSLLYWAMFHTLTDTRGDETVVAKRFLLYLIEVILVYLLIQLWIISRLKHFPAREREALPACQQPYFAVAGLLLGLAVASVYFAQASGTLKSAAQHCIPPLIVALAIYLVVLIYVELFISRSSMFLVVMLIAGFISVILLVVIPNLIVPRPSIIGRSADSDSGESSARIVQKPVPSASTSLPGLTAQSVKEDNSNSLSLAPITANSFETMPNLVDTLLFFPTTYPDGIWEPRGLEFEDAWFKAPDGSKLHGWYCPAQNPRGTLFFAHGNGGNLSHRAEFISRLQSRFGWNVFVFDYRGYGRSEGKPSSLGVLEDGEAALSWLLHRTGLRGENILFLGRSLGGAIAARLAAEHGGKALILENAFVSLREVGAVHYPPAMVALLVPDHLKTGESVADYHGPVVISHGDADTVIPFAHGRELAKRAQGPKLFVGIPGAGHNDPPPGWYYDRVEQFLTEQFTK